MSNYRDLHSDLPSRVFCLWQRTKLDASGSFEGLSVTAMLMAATAGFAMPWEVLKNQANGKITDLLPYPALERTNLPAYQKALEQCRKFFDKSVECADLMGIRALHCEELAEVRNAAENSGQATVIDLQQKNVRWLVRIFRNALAHSNIMTFGTNANQIERLAFFSENRIRQGCTSSVEGWHVLVMPVDVFEQFLMAWFELLASDQSHAAAATALADSTETA